MLVELQKSQELHRRTVQRQLDKEIPKQRYISSGERQKIIDDLRLILYYNNGILKNNKLLRQYTKSTI